MTTQLEEAFATYFEEIERCKAAQCYWSLLHLLVILPDICAALESDDGETNDGRYRHWCKRYFGPDKDLTPEDRYAVRCGLLHQGRTVTDRGRYGSYSFVQPTPTGCIFHRIVHDFGPEHKPNFTLDVSRMAVETVQAIRSWFADLQTAQNAPRLQNVKQHVRWLAREGEKIMPGISGIIVQTTSSTGGFSS